MLLNFYLKVHIKVLTKVLLDAMLVKDLYNVYLPLFIDLYCCNLGESGQLLHY